MEFTSISNLELVSFVGVFFSERKPQTKKMASANEHPANMQKKDVRGEDLRF